MTKRCRLCLETNAEDYYSLHEEYKAGPTYADFIQQLAGVEIEFDDGLPQEICEDCYCEIQRILEFSSGVRRADEELRNELNSVKRQKDSTVLENKYYTQGNEMCAMEDVLELDTDNQESFVVEEIHEGEEIHLVEEILRIDNEVITDEVIIDEVITDEDTKPCLQKEDLLVELAHVAATQDNVDVIDKNATNPAEYSKDENDEDYLIEFDPNETLRHNFKPPKWKCGECKVVLRGDVSYEGHMNMHKQLRPHKCGQCNWDFRCRTALKKHQEIRHTSRTNLELNAHEKNFQTSSFCEECKISFVTEVKCYLHEIMVHKKYTDISTCPFCSNIVENIKEHIQKSHNDYNVIENTFNNDNTLNSANTSISTVWQCNICSKIYHSLELLSNHQKLCQKTDEQQTHDIKVVYLDDMPTSTTVEYLENVPTTNNAKDSSENASVQCEVCKRKLLRRNLTKHMELHNRKDETRKYLCAHCRAANISVLDKIFSKPCNLQQNPLELRLDKQPSPLFQRNACVSEIGHLNFEQLPSTQDIMQICEFRDALKMQALENKHRTSLAKALISFILKNNPNKKLSGEDFLQLAQSIVEIFPSELKETYYVPFEKGHLAKGKLYDAYYNARTRLRAAGIIRRRVKSKSRHHSTANSLESNSDLDETSNSCNTQQNSFEVPEPHLEKQTVTFLQTNASVIKEEYPSSEEECPSIEEEYPNIKEEYPSSSQDKNLLFRTTNFQQLPSIEVIKQISEFRYALNIQTLENKHRINITNALISFILKENPERKLTKEDFLHLAQSIVDIFPSEVTETYYVPFKKGHLARGKLFIAYNNTKARLRAAGIIRKGIMSTSENYNTDNSISFLSASECSRDLDEMSNSGYSHQNSIIVPESLVKKQTDLFFQTNAGLNESAYLNFSRPNFYQQLPSTQEIKEIWEFRDALKVQRLENKHRTYIAKALISFILKNDPDRKLVREDFFRLAQSIVEIFPSEIKETYYVPCKNGHLAKGKLYIAYNNIKSRLSAAGVIRRRFKSKSENYNADNSISSLSASDSNSDTEEISNTSNAQQISQDTSESMLEEQTTSFIKANACVSETGNLNSSEGNNLCTSSKYALPTTQEIKKIHVVQYALNLQALENKHRTSIAKAIILFILKNNPDKKLSREDFLQLIESIVEIFPSEVKETYYVPFKKGRLAKGKLYDAYNNTKSRLSAAGVIRRRVKSKTENQTAKNVNICNTESADDPDESDFEILKSDCAEWDLVLTTWRKTHSFRQNELQTENVTISDYFEKYKVLFNEKNYELFDIDFKILYPMSKNISEWKLYYRTIIQKAKALQGDKVKELLTHIQNADNEDSKLALSLTLVSYLLPNCRQRKKWEIQESFICYCKDIADNELQHRIKRLKIESHPKVFLIGDSNKTISLAYVDICGNRLKFENPTKAIEVCFQSFMVMNIKYPKYCSHVWIFIQKLIFKINTPWDTVIPAINTLINDLHSDIQK